METSRHRGEPVEQCLLREDLQACLRRRAIDPLALSVPQRILLSADGTVTEILEAYFAEPMRVVKLGQVFRVLEQPEPILELIRGDQVLERKVLLRGEVSLMNALYAESMIVPDRLDPLMRDALIKSEKSIGRLFLEHRIETFKEILDCGYEPSGVLAQTFQIQPKAPLIFRAYRIFAERRPIMYIREKFPAERFR